VSPTDRPNRVDPWGDLHVAHGRGLFTGNRGCLVDRSGAIVRHHDRSLWITCLTEFRARRQPLDAPGRWTPLFFLDDAVALAAGHRPCATCRRAAYRSYRDAVGRALGRDEPVRATELNHRLGVDRAADRRPWSAPFGELPDGTVVVGDDGDARLVVRDRTFAFTHAGWTAPCRRPTEGVARVLTPATSVVALREGFDPVLHPSAS
jgi:hypothetical protein